MCKKTNWDRKGFHVDMRKSAIYDEGGTRKLIPFLRNPIGVDSTEVGG
jgi:hypothetical protein